MWQSILALTWKDLKIFFRDPGALVLIFLQPFMFIVVMSFALSGMFTPKEGQIHLLVVNQDTGPYGAFIIEDLRTLDAFVVEETWEGTRLTPEQAEALIRAGRRTMALVIPPGFSDTLLRKAEQTPSAGVRFIVDPAVTDAVVEPVLGTLNGIVMRVAYRHLIPTEIKAALAQMAPQWSPSQQTLVTQRITRLLSRWQGGEAGSPRVVKVTPKSMPVREYPDAFQQNVPGYTIYGIFWIVSLLAGSVLEERRTGTFQRLMAAPISRGVMLAGKLLPYYVINLIQIAIMLGTSSLLFGLHLGHSPAGLVVVSMAAAASATGMGVLVAALARTEAQIGGVTVLLLLTFSALGGCFVPRFVMPDWMQTVGLITPHAWALDAYQDLFVRGYGLKEVLPKVGALLAFALASFGAGVWKFRFQ